MGISGSGSIPKFNTIVAVDTAIASGAAGWIDTDLSGTIGAKKRICLFVVTSVGVPNTGFGVRPTGSALAAILAIVPSVCTLLSESNASGHVDLYRDDATNLNYRLVGYYD